MLSILIFFFFLFFLVNPRGNVWFQLNRFNHHPVDRSPSDAVHFDFFFFFFFLVNPRGNVWFQLNRFNHHPVDFTTDRSKAVFLVLFVLCWVLWLLAMGISSCSVVLYSLIVVFESEELVAVPVFGL